MIKREVENVTVQEISIKEIKCDICGKQLFKNKKNHEEIEFGYLACSRVGVAAAKSGEVSDQSKQESSDFCRTCYDKIVEFVRGMGAKIPSNYLNLDDISNEENLEEVVKILNEEKE